MPQNFAPHLQSKPRRPNFVPQDLWEHRVVFLLFFSSEALLLEAGRVIVEGTEGAEEAERNGDVLV